MGSTLRHKRGDTFDLSGGPVTIDTPEGVLTDLTGWTGRSEMRAMSGALYASLTFEWLDATEGLFRLYFEGSTADWKPATLSLDVEFTSPDGVIVSTDRASVAIEGDQTR